MNDVYRKRVGSASVVWFHKKQEQSNQHCLYCGRFVGVGSDIDSNKEHLIGRNMLPEGSFSDPNAFNFIFRSCVDCNTEKSHLEDHVSAVSLFTSPSRSDSEIDELARRKAESSFAPTHPGKRVAEVRNEQTINFGNVISFGFVAPAQLEPVRTRLLAFRHIQGFFSLITSSDPLSEHGTRLLPSYHFGFHGYYSYRDWGNAHLAEMTRRVKNIPIAAAICTAGGFFQAILRKPNENGVPWFWALEWNRNVRLVGWVGKADEVPDFCRDLPDLGWHELTSTDGVRIRTREEKILADAEDMLFAV